MEQSLSFLKRQCEEKRSCLLNKLNEVKAVIVKKDIAKYLKQTGYVNEEPYNMAYGTRIAENIFARSSDVSNGQLSPTGGKLCLEIEDRRSRALLWVFSINFEAPIRTTDLIQETNPQSGKMDYVYVRDISVDTENEKIRDQITDVIEELNQSLSVVQGVSVDSGYTYSCINPEIENLNGIEAVMDVLLARK